VMSVPSVFVVHPNVPARSMREFIALAKAKPGKYTFASPGNGSLGHVNIEQFMDLAGIQLMHVPYKGAGQAATDALAGVVDSMTDNLPSTLPNIKAGKLRALAVLSPQRSAALPDVPTYKELGFTEMSEGGWFGAGTGWGYSARLAVQPVASDATLLPHAEDLLALARFAWARGEAVEADQAQPIYLRDQVATPKAAH